MSATRIVASLRLMSVSSMGSSGRCDQQGRDHTKLRCSFGAKNYAGDTASVPRPGGDPGVVQAADFRGRKAEDLGQHLVGMLAEPWRWARRLARRGGEVQRQPGR